MIFVDTGAWFAAFVPNDPDHAAAARWLRQNREPLVTTDSVIDEVLTLMLVRGERQRALRLGKALLDGLLAELHWIGPDEVLAAWQTYRQYTDKGWGCTDCTSRVVMQRRGIQAAFAFDLHFRQFGLGAVLTLESDP